MMMRKGWKEEKRTELLHREAAKNKPRELTSYTRFATCLLYIVYFIECKIHFLRGVPVNCRFNFFFFASYRHMLTIVGRHGKIHQMHSDVPVIDVVFDIHEILCNQEYECLEQENSMLRKEVQLLIEEQQCLTDALKAHEPLCPVLNCGMTSTTRSTGTVPPEFMSRWRHSHLMLMMSEFPFKDKLSILNASDSCRLAAWSFYAFYFKVLTREFSMLCFPLTCSWKINSRSNILVCILTGSEYRFSVVVCYFSHGVMPHVPHIYCDRVHNH